MKLGTTTLPLAGWLADPRRPEESRTHRLAAIRELVDKYGLSAVELTLDLSMVFPQVFGAGFYAAVADLQQELGFTCTVHLPFLWVDLSSLNEPVRLASMDCIERSIELTRPVQVSTYVLHLWGAMTTLVAAEFREPAQRQALLGALQSQAARSLADACELVEPRDLCIENLEDGLFKMVLPLVEQHSASICLDVGHLAWDSSDELEFLTKHAARIREVHLHDASSPSPGGETPFRDHMPLGQGELDYARFLGRLHEVGFDGAVILEVNSKRDLEESLARIRASGMAF
jgi:sugar phosphate isomerase/epimerase